MALKPESVSKIALLMDNRGDSNWGSQATTNALVSLLQERFPAAQILGVPRTATLPPKPLRKWVSKSAPDVVLNGNGQTAVGTLMRHLLTGRWSQAWRDADLVVINGEGTLHPQKQLDRWLPAVCLLQERWRRPLWIVNSSINFSDSSYEALFKKFLSAADCICVRESISHKELEKHGIASNLVADCAFLTKPEQFDFSGIGIKPPYAVLTGSIQSRGWSPATFDRIVAHLEAQGLSVVFTSSTTQDDLLHSKISAKPTLLTHRQLSYRQLMALQGEAKILVGGRYHPTILAALCGTPFVALPSNTTKMDALMDVLGTEEFFLDPEDQGVLIGKIDQALSREDWFRTQVQNRALSQKDLARQNVFLCTL